MSLADDLLETARALLRRNGNKPSEADLRRSVSTAYYALFHKLIESAVFRLAVDVKMQAALGRHFEHGRMKEICKDLQASKPQKFGRFFTGAIPSELAQVAKTFVDLQQKRHDADYDTATPLQKLAARDLVAQCGRAFRDWKAIELDPSVPTFLLLLLIGEPKNR